MKKRRDLLFYIYTSKTLFHLLQWGCCSSILSLVKTLFSLYGGICTGRVMSLKQREKIKPRIKLSHKSNKVQYRLSNLFSKKKQNIFPLLKVAFLILLNLVFSNLIALFIRKTIAWLTLQKFYGTAQVKLEWVPKTRFGSG